MAAAFLAWAVWIALKPRDWQNWLGFSHDAYFKTGQSYAFFSGPAPVIVATLGLSGIIVTLLRHVNCHVDGCPRISRHKIANGEYGVCGKHWREVTDHDADHKFTVAHLREHHRAHLRATGRGT